MEERFEVSLKLEDAMRFGVDFGVGEGLVMDEPPPVGEGAGPNAARVLAAAIGNCLSASLLFCLRKSRVAVDDMQVRVAGELVRNEKGRYRIGKLSVTIDPKLSDADPARVARCREIFEDFCIVTQSVRQGLAVDVQLNA